jgi:hypothetical protein
MRDNLAKGKRQTANPNFRLVMETASAGEAVVIVVPPGRSTIISRVKLIPKKTLCDTGLASSILFPSNLGEYDISLKFRRRSILGRPDGRGRGI